MSDVKPCHPSRSGTGVIRSPMQELPLDVCLEIIAATLGWDFAWEEVPLQNLVRLSHISSNFRQAALQSAPLWAAALNVNHPHPTAFDTVLSRTRAAPLWLREISMDVKSVLVAKRTKQLLDNEAGRLKSISAKFQPDEELEPFWTALEKPTPLLSRVDLSTRVNWWDRELRLLRPRKKLFEDATSDECVLILQNCSVPDTLVAAHKLAGLHIVFQECRSRLTTKDLCRWWSICVDGISMPSLKYLGLFSERLYDIKKHPESLSLLSANPAPRLPPNLESLSLAIHPESLIILLENVPVPPSCRTTQFDFLIGDWDDNADHLTEKLTAIFSRFWKSRVGSPAHLLSLEIKNHAFRFRYNSVNRTFKITFGMDNFIYRAPHRFLIKEMLDRMASEDHFPGLREFNPNCLLYLEVSCDPELASHLHEPLMGLLKSFDQVRLLDLGPFELSTDAMNVLRSPRVSSMSADNKPEGERLLLPNLYLVRLDKQWLTSETLVNTLNHFASERDKFGAPVNFVTGYIEDRTLTVLRMPLAVPQPQKEIAEGRKPREEMEGAEGEHDGYAEEDKGEEYADNKGGNMYEDEEQEQGSADNEGGGDNDEGEECADDEVGDKSEHEEENSANDAGGGIHRR